MDDSVDSELNVSSVSFETSTPKGPRKKTPFAKPFPPSKKKKLAFNPDDPRAKKCPHCGKVYISQRYYDNHIMSHKLKDASSAFPDKEKFAMNKLSICTEVLKKMMDTPPVGKYGAMCQALVNDILQSFPESNKYHSFIEEAYQTIVDAVVTKQFCLPSVLLKSILQSIENILTDVDLRERMLSNFPSEEGCEVEVINCVYVEFVFTMGDKILHFIRMCVTEKTEPSLSPIVTIDEVERQLIHYVSGSVIRAYLRKARKVKKNPVWFRVQKAITMCILEGDVVVAAGDRDRYWTEFCDRGGLLYVGKNFQEFMTSVVQLLYAVEKPDGSIFHEEVQEKLLNSPARILWDNMIGTNLPEDESIAFMRGVVRSFTSSYGKGVSNKHRNHQLHRPKATMSLRKRLGAKSAT